MTAVLTKLPEKPSGYPPVVLIHGAANSAIVWTYWQDALAEAGLASYAMNLRGHGPGQQFDLSTTSMHDYADDIHACVVQLDRKPVVMGWSMGGLIAMMVATSGEASACVGLAPSTPARSQDASVDIRHGEFGPEEYGVTSTDPEEQPSMPDLEVEEREVALASLAQESRRARDERAAGIVIESLPCPLLIATGSNDEQWPKASYDGLWLDAEYHEIDGASHWGMVLSRRAISAAAPQVANWVTENTLAR